jgi:nucleoside diphosphate kinase
LLFLYFCYKKDTNKVVEEYELAGLKIEEENHKLLEIKHASNRYADLKEEQVEEGIS